MMNHIDIMGRIVNDLELKETGSGVKYCSFRIACDEDFVPKDGERTADFFTVVVWRSAAEFVCKHFGKGRMIAVSGKLKTRTWEAKDGGNRTAVEIVADNVYFADSKQADTGEKSKSAAPAKSTKPAAVVADDEEEEGLPF